MDNSFAAIVSLLDFIDNNDLEKIEQLSRRLPLSKLSLKASDKLLVQLLENCSFRNRPECSVLIYDIWAETNPEEERFSLLSYMLSKEMFSNQVIQFLIIAKKNVIVFEIFQEIMTRDDSQESAISIRRLFEITKFPEYEELLDYKKYIDEITEREKVPICRTRNYITYLIGEKSPYKERPNYLIKSDLTEDEIQNTDVVNFKDLPIEQKISMLMREVDKTLVLNESDRAQLIQRITSNIPNEPKKEQDKIFEGIYKDYYVNMMGDVELFRKFGPSSILDGTVPDDSNFSDPCQRYGGCRLFLCVCSETLGDEEDFGNTLEDPEYPEDVEWFKGRCDICHLKILKKCDVVRFPGPSGGWIGCYCSWNCVRKTLKLDYTELRLQDSISEKLIDEFENAINKNGIYDRIY